MRAGTRLARRVLSRVGRATAVTVVLALMSSLLVAGVSIGAQAAPTDTPSADLAATGESSTADQPSDDETTSSEAPSGQESSSTLVEPTGPGEASPASAGTAGTYIQQSQSWFAYVGAGENLDVLFTKANDFGTANTTTIRLRGPGGIDEQCVLQSAADVGDTCSFPNRIASTPGIWQIDFETNAGIANTDFFTWDIDVQSGSADVPGRVYSTNYKIRQAGTGASVDFSLWYKSEQGFLYRGDYGDFNGINSLFTADATGVALLDTCISAYESMDGGLPPTFPYGDEGRLWDPPIGDCGDPYKIFFENPDSSMPASATLWDGSQVWLHPAVTLPTIDGLDFVRDNDSTTAGEFTFEVTDFTGQLTVEIDANGDGDYTDPEDRDVPAAVTQDGTVTVDFDGLDGQGNPIPATRDINARVALSKVGEIHFENSEVEMRGSLAVTALNGPENGSQTLYWNDTNLRTADRDSTIPPLDGRAGVDSGGGVHGWVCADMTACNPNDGTNGGWGDYRVIDDWTYHTIDVADEIAIEGVAVQCGPGGTLVPVDLIQNPSFESRTGDFQNTAANSINFATDWHDSHPTGGQYHVFSPSFDSGPAAATMPIRAGADGYAFMGGHSSGPGDVGEGATNTLVAPLDPLSTYVGYYSMAAGGYGRQGNGYMQFYGVNDPEIGHLPYAAVVPPTAGNTELLFTTPVVDFPGAGVTPQWQQVPFTLDASQAWPYLRVEVRNETPADNATVAGQVWMNFDDFHLFECEYDVDFGDAPDTYDTLLADAGARHNIVPGLALGSDVDGETDGQPGAAADGDGVDEDGVTVNPALGYPNATLRTGLDPNSQQPLENTLEVEASADGFVSVWVDWNMDGDFADAGEQVANAQAVTAGTNDVTFSQATNPPGIETYVRVRYSTDAASIGTPTGSAPDGEVEDYRVLVERLVQPDTCTVGDVEYYAFTFETPIDRTGTGGVGSTARYANVSVIDGVAVDMFVEVTAGQMRVAGSGSAPPNGFWAFPGTDDAAWQITEDATIRYTFYEAGTTTPVPVNAVFTIDDLDDPESATFSATDLAGYAVTQGSSVVVTESGSSVVFDGTFDGNATPQQRFQVVFEGTSTFEARWQGFVGSGFAFDGDGDNGIESPACEDFGDAPEPYDTLQADNGARHTITQGLFLGGEIDFDPDGQPTAGADGDDSNRVDDEDGVSGPIEIVTGDPSTVVVSATNTTTEDAILVGWIDLDGNGVFDAGEASAPVTVPAGSGTADYDLTFPAGAVTADTYARFRLFPGTVTAPSPTGPADAGEVEDYPVVVFDRSLDIDKTSDATEDSRPGDVITYTITARNTGTSAYTAANPANVWDDLSGVLDDATYNNDATADRGPTPSYSAPIVSWEGELAPNEMVTITYTVTLQAGGDGEVRNVAFGLDCDPADPDCDTTTPQCDPPTDEGTDPDTGLPCAEHEFELPRLQIDKVADVTELPGVGETVTYTVTATNVGPGVYTPTAPAPVTDDLTDVLDDATYNGDATADRGPTASYSAPIVSWEGPLAVDETVTITYTVTYTGEGDHILVNTACVPDDQVVLDDEPCASVEIPAAFVEDGKSVEASDDPLVAGSTLTYTLTFENIGEAAGTVDKVDNLLHVLDDADVTVQPVVDPAGALTVSPITNGQFSITGTLDPDEVVTVTYEVTIKPEGERGDNVAANFLLLPTDPPPCDPAEEDCEVPPCEPAPGELPDCTTTPIGEIEDGKSVEASDDPLVAGSTLTYTLTFENIGNADAVVDKVDNLLHVLDDADVTVQPVSSDPSKLTVSPIANGEFSITGTLEPGDIVTVTYEVTIKPEGERGDNQANNYLVEPGMVICDPATDEDCVPPPCIPAIGELPDCTVTPIGEIVDSKAVEASDDPLVTGSILTYTLTFENVGNADAVVDKVDNLLHVLDDADVTTQPVVDPAGELTVSPIAGGQFSITGTLQPGDIVTISYEVTIKPEGERGDNVAANFLLLPTDPPPCDPAGEDCTVPPCEAAPGELPDCTTTPIGEIDDGKSVVASDDPVVAGTVLTYTLTFENVGNADAPVHKIDHLGEVLDDADVTVQPVVDPAGELLVSPVSNGDFEITGTLPPGEVVTVTYEVTLRPDGQRGDDIAANYLIEPGEEVCEPGEEGCEPCAPAPGELPDCTVTPVGEVIDSKAVEASDDPLLAGSTLTYTLTFENTGEGPAPVYKVDNLLHVLDDGDVTTPPAVDPAGELTVSPIANGQFSVTGTLDAGEVVIVTYTVTVKPDGERGDNVAANYLIEPGEVICDPADEDCAPPPCEPADGELPDCTVNKLPELEDWKEVVAGDDPLVAGSTLSYTLTFTNTGAAPGTVDKVDNLLHVLDDADVTVQPVSSDPSKLTVSPIANGQFSITGTLEPGDVVTVTYEVTLRPDGERGDNQAVNFLLPPVDPPPCDPADEDCVVPPCEPADGERPDCTVTEIPEIEDTKSVDPASTTPVTSGQELTYTLTFTNTGTAAGPVDEVDDLTHVLDDAELTSGPTTSDPALTVTGLGDDGRIHITGELAPDQTVTVTYTVTVKEVADRGDDILANFLLPPDEEPPTDPVCEPVEGEEPDCTVNPVGDLDVDKTVDPDSGTEVGPGDELTYTLTFTNTGKGETAVDYTDHAAGLLDDATLLDGPTASDPSLTISEVTDGAYTVSGTLAGGQTVTVTYTVEVKPHDELGDGLLENFLTPSGEKPPAECVETNPLCTENPVEPPADEPPAEEPPGEQPPGDRPPSDDDLADTGADLRVPILLSGMALLAGGLLLLATVRRRNQAAGERSVNVDDLI